MRKILWAVLIIGIVAMAAVIMQSIEQQGKQVKIYFFKAGKLIYEKRTPAQKADLYYFTIEQLLQGPTADEKVKGVYSQIPEGTKVRVAYKQNDTVNVDFTKDLEMYGGGTSKVYGSLAQIVYTLTSLQGIKQVQILINGRREISLGSEGLIIDKPLTRKDVSP